MAVDRVNQVWAADITYLPMSRGFLYLVAIMDWHSRYVLSWRLSNTLGTDFCIDALKEALSKGQPEIFNTDQGSQFTREAFSGLLLERGIKVSMDGKGRYLDNIFVERLWRSVKYEEVYLKAYRDGSEARRGIARLSGLLQSGAATPVPGLSDSGSGVRARKTAQVFTRADISLIIS